MDDKKIIKILDKILHQIEEFTRTLLELRRVGRRLATIAEEEEEVDSEAETVVLDEDLKLAQNFPPIVPLHREDAVPICYTHARRY